MTSSTSDLPHGFPSLKVAKYATVIGYVFGPLIRCWRKWSRHRAARRLVPLVERVRQCETKEEVVRLLGKPRCSVSRRAFQEIPEEAVDSLRSDPFYERVWKDLELLDQGALTNREFKRRHGKEPELVWEELFGFAEEHSIVKMADIVEIYVCAGCELAVGFVGLEPSVLGTRLETNQWDYVSGIIDGLRRDGINVLSYWPGYFRDCPSPTSLDNRHDETVTPGEDLGSELE